MFAMIIWAVAAAMMVAGFVDGILENTDGQLRKGLTVIILAAAFVAAITVTARAEVVPTEVLGLVNEVRAEQGVEPLSYSSELQDAANVRAWEAEQVWSHTRPDGSDWYTVDSKVYGENLGYGYDSAEELVAAWVSSPTHYANLINPKFKTMSLGLSGIYVAQEFGY